MEQRDSKSKWPELEDEGLRTRTQEITGVGEIDKHFPYRCKGRSSDPQHLSKCGAGASPPVISEVERQSQGIPEAGQLAGLDRLASSGYH